MIPIVPIAIAGAIGAAGALLLSPHSGRENREIAAEKLKVNEARDLISGRMASIRKKGAGAEQGESEPVEIEPLKGPDDREPGGEAAGPEGEVER